MDELAIHTEQLAKTYDGKVFALHDLTIDIAQGEVFGFLGPNGAGKTTTVKLLTGLLKPSQGSCTVMGLSPTLRSSDVHRLCGVMTESETADHFSAGPNYEGGRTEWVRAFSSAGI